MEFTLLYIVVGLVFIVMALAVSVLKPLPLSTALLYLLAGISIGPVGLDIVSLDIVEDAGLIERLTEVAVVVSLFSAGLKLRFNWRDRLWLMPVRLATVAMVLTVGMVAIVGWVGLGLSLGASILLGAALAPTDPVLASDVQVANPEDRDQLRFGLTGEAGMNDGAAFPFVMLGLGLMGHHELGTAGLRWITVDVIWAVLAGVVVGLVLGTTIGQLVLSWRVRYQQAIGLDDFLTLGLIALAYGCALIVHGYGFLAVFVAGLALRKIEQEKTPEKIDEQIGEETMADSETATETVADRKKASPLWVAQRMLRFNEQLERIGEVAIVIILGILLFDEDIPWQAFWFVPLLFLVIRPISVRLGLFGEKVAPIQGRIIAWFGIRGIGSIYYLTYAYVHGIQGDTAELLSGLVLSTVAVSILVHGISVTPLMTWYDDRVRARKVAPG